MSVLSRSLRAFLWCAPLLPSILQAQTIVVTPKNPYVGVGFTQQFQATVTGLANTSVTWSLTGMGKNNPKLGTITTSGLYTAPAEIPAQNPITVQATGSDGKTLGSTYVLVEPLGPTLTSISPSSIPIKGYTPYRVTITGSGFQQGAQVFAGPYEIGIASLTPTTIVATGGQMASGSLTFRVKNPGSTMSNGITVVFVSASQGEPITVSPSAESVALGATQKFTATGQSNVTWSASAGTISTMGLFTAPATMPASSTVIITATGTGNQSGTATVTLIAPAQPITVSPSTANVTLGGTQQFTTTGQSNVTWSASAGTISTVGLFTAPATMPASSTVIITATGTGNQSGTATVTLIAPAQPITLSPSTSNVMLGGTQQFTTTGQSNVTWSASAGTISTMGLFTAPATMPASNTVLIKAAGAGNQSGTATVTLTGGTNQVTASAAAHFLRQAAFGPSPSDVANVQSLGFQGWLNQQFAMPAISNYQSMLAGQGGFAAAFLTNAVSNSDQLRQRVAFALSQIAVVSLNTLNFNPPIVAYEQLLLNDTFTNYRQILGDVTLNAAMGTFLNMANNAAANPATGSVANENYAREIMQLFSIGTAVLNQDGTRQTDSSGNPIPTYNQKNVVELARVFTGWTYAQPIGTPVSFGAWSGDVTQPMVPVTAFHDFGSKTLLPDYLNGNGTAPYVAPANLTPDVDLSQALDNIFYNPNVGPFVGKELIKFLVKSDPTPAYVSRVAATFANNGQGVRGDMKAMITAILTDSEARENDTGDATSNADFPADGHLQEPALYIAGVFRALNGSMAITNYFPFDIGNMSQDVFDPPSVFNYYSPSYTIPQTKLQGGEFQIYNTYTSLYRANVMAGLFSEYSNPVQSYGPSGTTIDLTPFINIVTTRSAAAMVDALDVALTCGQMPAAMKSIILSAVNGESGNPLAQVETGIYLIVTSNYYNVWH